MQIKKIAIIGAGPAGLTAAYKLSQNKENSVTVYEAADTVGGMCKSIKLWGSIVDIGPHRYFSYDKRINNLWMEVAKNDYKMVNRLTRIFYRNKFFYYPVQAFDALKKVGIWTAAVCLFTYFKEKIIPTKQDGSFQAWVTRNFGSKLYKMFFKTYSEKLWGMDCKDLDEDFAAQRIKKLSLWSVVVNAFTRQDRTRRDKTRHKTLIDEFAYPIKGTGSIYTKMAEVLINNGGKIITKHKIRGIAIEDGSATGIILQDGSIEKYDEVISSMPITDVLEQWELPETIKEKVKKLRYRNTIIVYLEIEHPHLFDDNWLYVHSPELNMGRITNFRNWVSDLYGSHNHTILALEYWCYNEDPEWKRTDEEWLFLASLEIEKTGLTKGNKVKNGFVYRIEKSYPTYHKGYKNDLEPIEKYLSEIEHLQFIGRYGSFKYNNQDHSILMGLLAADNISHKKKNNLWKVNTDYDTYQESSLITATGLEDNIDNKQD
jgi:protoporphyrinogen oxidase